VRSHLNHGDKIGPCTSTANRGNFVFTNAAKEFRLSSYPNPFTGKSTIKYELPYDSKVSIKVYDIMGRVVATIVDAERKAGIHTVVFNAGGVSKGFLYYKIVAQSKDNRFEQTNKMIHIQ
ncbi:MAG: T9SS type A sorting domain-containing protein, partial [Chitinophagaceae bacterium]